MPSSDSVFQEKVTYINELIRLQEFDVAIDDLKKLILSRESEGEKGYCYWLLYYSYSSKGDIEATAKNYLQAVQHYNSALNYLEINNVFLKAINFPPFETYTSRGICQIQLKNYKVAIFDFDKAISLNPKHGLAFFNRGLSYHHLGNMNTACADYLDAYKFDYPVESRLIEGCRLLIGN
jgi:tetratricopeptide (TPR) repeat protein